MMRYLFLILSLFLVAYRAEAAEPAVVLYDTAEIHARSFSQKAMKAYAGDRQFQYERITEPPSSWLDRFWEWVGSWFSKLGKVKGADGIFNIVILILTVSIVVFFIIKLVGMNGSSLFGKSNTGSAIGYVSGENIHTIHFEDAIGYAIAEKNFRLAVRLLYLQSLKHLSDRGLIRWQIDKTNIAYVQELRDTGYQQHFGHLTFQFENNWYGDLPIGETEFSGVSEQFIQFNRQIK
jgi:hypothetical protein